MGVLGKMVDKIGINYPAVPKFTPAIQDSRRENLTTSFYLINSSSHWLRKNFEFIQAIFAGTSWLHMNYCLVRPTNVYHVLCPGRFQIYWAAMNSEITFCGKLRKNETVSNELRSLGIHSIDKDMLWPDAWKITLTIKDLTPNNFNNYAEYYMNGFNEVEVASLAQRIEFSEILGEIGKYVANIIEDGKGYVINAIDRANASLPKLQSTLKSGIASLTNMVAPNDDAAASINKSLGLTVDPYSDARLSSMAKQDSLQARKDKYDFINKVANKVKFNPTEIKLENNDDKFTQDYKKRLAILSEEGFSDSELIDVTNQELNLNDETTAKMRDQIIMEIQKAKKDNKLDELTKLQ